MLDHLFGNHAAWFTVPAMTGTLFYMLRLLMALAGAGGDDGGHDMSMGDHGATDLGAAGGHAGHDGMDVGGAGADGGHGDAAHGTGHGTGHGDGWSIAKFLSLQPMLMFAMGFGWTAYGFYRGVGLPFGAAMGLGVVGGILLVGLFTKLMTETRKLEQSGTFDLRSAVGAEGQVYLTVPARGQGRGQVRVTVGDRARIVDALSEGDALAPPARVKVLRVNADRSLTVTRA